MPFELNAIFAIAAPEHIDWLLLVATIVGVGLTVTVTVVVEVQLPAEAVIVNVVDCTELVVLTRDPVILEPDPLGIPVSDAVIFVLVQLSTVPATLLGLLSSISVIGPEHIVCVADGVAATVGTGFTTTGTVVKLEQPAAVAAVIVNVVVCCTLVVLVNVPEIGVPVPLASMPVKLPVLFLVQV